MTAAVTYFVLRVSLGAICLWAGLEKARGLNTFAHTSCYCFTYLNIICRPQRNSGDTPCTCPPLTPPVRVAA